MTFSKKIDRFGVFKVLKTTCLFTLFSFKENLLNLYCYDEERGRTSEDPLYDSILKRVLFTSLDVRSF